MRGGCSIEVITKRGSTVDIRPEYLVYCCSPPAADTYQRDVRIPRQAGRSHQTGPDERMVCHLTVPRPMRDDQTEATVC